MRRRARGRQAIPAPLTLACAVTGPAACVGWDAREPSVEPTLRFEAGDERPARAVTIETGEGTVRATRAGGG